MKLGALIFLCLTVSGAPELPWPDKVAEPTFVETSSVDLPKELQKTLPHYDDFEKGTKQLPDTLNVCRVSLRSKGDPGFIVMVPDGFSGGPEEYFFEERGGRYIEIGFEQGLLYFGPRVNGYYQLICQSRGGAGAFVRILLQFKNDRYRAVRMTDYHHDDGGSFNFVRERDPKEFGPE